MLLVAGLTASAQMTDHISNLQVNLGGGVHMLKYKPVNGDLRLGWGGLAEIQYQAMFNHNLGIGIGVQVSNLNGKAYYDMSYKANDFWLPGAIYPATVETKFYHWGERQRVYQVSVPVELIVRAPLSVRCAFQMGLGATVDFPFKATYKPTDGNYVRTAYMPNTNVTYEDMPEHGLGTFSFGSQREEELELNKYGVGLLADLGFVINLSNNTGLYLGVYGNYGLMNYNPKYEQNLMLVQEGYYRNTFASNQVGKVYPLEAGLKIGLRFGMGKDVDWKANLAAEQAAAAQAEAERLEAARQAEAERLQPLTELFALLFGDTPAESTLLTAAFCMGEVLFHLHVWSGAHHGILEDAAEQKAKEEAMAKARAEAEAKAKAEADSIARAHAAEMAKAKAEADAQAAALARAKAQADSLAAAKANAEARLKAEAEARAKAEAEARARARAEQKAREEVAFVTGYKDVAYCETAKDMPIFGQLNEDSWVNLKEIMAKNPDIKVTVTGHTDNVGKAAMNLNLSKRRAENIKKMLVEKGIDGNRIQTFGKGETEPIESNDTEAGRAKNRRIEITIGK